MVSVVNVGRVRESAEEFFRSGGFYCSEAIVASIRQNIAPEMSEELIAAASGFPIGVGRTKCICGAISGAVICLGHLLGRTSPSSPSDPKSQNCLKLANEIQENFRANHKGVSCCSVHTKGMDMAGGEHKCQCVAFMGEMSAKVAEIAARELGLAIVEGSCCE